MNKNIPSAFPSVQTPLVHVYNLFKIVPLQKFSLRSLINFVLKSTYTPFVSDPIIS